MKTIRTYSELIRFRTFEERFRYLKLNGTVGNDTFGCERWMNQRFYTSKEWRRLRDELIVRDSGCDLAVPDMEIYDRIIIHHMNPITADDIRNNIDYIMNPEFLICVSDDTHKAIHYGCEANVPRGFAERRPGDTCPWKKG